MGLSLTSIHIYGNTAPADCGFTFRSFSPDWLTCVDDFGEKGSDYSYKSAKLISKQTDAPVLHFGIFDSEMIWFDFFLKGKVVSRYSDDELVANKKLFDIPALIGYGEGYKKRLSSLLSCSDIDQKIAMLEEYFGVCLLFSPEFLDEPHTLVRKRSDICYQQYQAEEKALTGKMAPMHLDLIAEYPGKLFYDVFGKMGMWHPHFFMYGYADVRTYNALIPVQFMGERLEKSTVEAFEKDMISSFGYKDPRFQIKYGTPNTVTFSEECPPDYRGKTMTLPNGFYPQEFLPSGELLLCGNHRLFVADCTFKIIAKLSVKGDIADVLDDYILTTAGGSFFAYCYEPKARIYIYKIVKK